MLSLKTIFGSIMLTAKLQCILLFTTNSAQRERSVTRHANLLISLPEVPVLLNQLTAFGAWNFPVGSLPPGIVQPTKPTTSSFNWLTALFAWLWFSPAFKTHLLFPLRHISFKNVFPAFKAVCSIVFALPKLLVVIVAHTPCNGRFIAKLAVPFGVMDLFVMSVVLTKNQIFMVVVVTHTIFVMHNFFRLKKATNFLFHHKSVLINISSLITKRMVRRINDNVASWSAVFSAFPVWVKGTFQWHQVMLLNGYIKAITN